MNHPTIDEVDPAWRVFVGIAQLLTMDGPGPTADDTLGLISDAAIVTDGAGTIRWLGPRTAMADIQGLDAAPVIDLGGVIALPALVDPHTHLVFAGDRAADFAARCAGATYAEIAAAGGGLVTTVTATRAASAETLVGLAKARLDALAREGVLTVEIKSGYGLTISDELKQLAVIQLLRELVPQRLVATLLLHKVPPELADTPETWFEAVCDELLPRARPLAEFVDIFVDVGAYTPEAAAPLMARASALGFKLKAHTEQLTASGFGAAMAELGATSLEHLEHASEAVLDAMAAHGTVAVLLPGASVFLGDDARPPVRAMRARGIPMALGTDLNPGSSATSNPWLIATLACTQYGLSPAEALIGLTRNAASAIGQGDRAGRLAVGRRADFVTSRVPTWLHLTYGLGHHPVYEVYLAGQPLPQLGLDLAFS